MAKKRRKKAAAKAKAAQRPTAPRTEAQIAAARENIAKAQAAKAEKAAQASAHPADDASRPRAFFTLGERRQGERANTGDSSASDKSDKGDKTPPKPLTATEADSLRKKLIDMLVSLWELADKGLTATAFDGEECLIWRSIDDSDTAFLADRILAKGRENPYVGAQVRLLIDHWSDARMVAILGPRVLESAGWHQAHGLKVAAFGLDIQTPPKPKRGKRGAAQNGYQAGPMGATAPYSASATEAYPYGAQ